MSKRILVVFLAVLVLLMYAMPGLASESEGDLYTFCPYLSTSRYNTFLKNLLELSDSQATLLQVTSDGLIDDTMIYSDLLRNTYFMFNGVSSEYDTATSAYISCSLEDSSALKNIPMLLWASIIEFEYYGELTESGSSFLEWVNTERKDGETFYSPYFIASYSETPNESCSLLLIKL